MQIFADSIDKAYIEAFNFFNGGGWAHFKREDMFATELTQRGAVLAIREPLLTILRKPLNNALLDEERDANPFFHLAEFFWIMRGENAAAPLNVFIRDFGDRYAEPDGTIWGAYGHRLRKLFGFDQIAEVIKLLRRSRNTRRAVLEIWDARSDLNDDEKRDRPCNTHCYFRIQENTLSMTVCSRSHDIIWGVLGANAVHFSLLLDCIAQLSGCKTGELIFLSNNPHVYLDVFEAKHRLFLWEKAEPLTQAAPETYFPELFTDASEDTEIALKKLQAFQDKDVAVSSWFTDDVAPLLIAHDTFKKGNFEQALKIAETTFQETKFNPAWPYACYRWLARRIVRKMAKDFPYFTIAAKDII